MLILILIVILSLAAISLYSERLPKTYHKYLFAGIAIILVLICMTRPGSYVSDYKNYEKYFYSFDNVLTQLTVEPTFLWFSRIVYNMGGTVRQVIYIYALISLPLKLYAIRKMTNETLFLLAIVVYSSHFFMLHDCEQIRLAAAMAFGMYAIYLKSVNSKWWFAFVLMGTSFHHTLMLLTVPLLLCPKELGKTWKIILCCTIPVAIALWVLDINLIASLPIPYIERRLRAYEIAIAEGLHPDVRVINSMVIFRIFMFYYILYFYDNIKPHLKALNILILCNALSITTWFVLSDMSVIAVRISQLYGFVEIILFACIYYTVRPPFAGKAIITCIALYFFIQNYVYNQFGFR